MVVSLCILLFLFFFSFSFFYSLYFLNFFFPPLSTTEVFWWRFCGYSPSNECYWSVTNKRDIVWSYFYLFIFLFLFFFTITSHSMFQRFSQLIKRVYALWHIYLKSGFIASTPFVTQRLNKQFHTHRRTHTHAHTCTHTCTRIWTLSVHLFLYTRVLVRSLMMVLKNKRTLICKKKKTEYKRIIKKVFFFFFFCFSG